MPKSLVRRSREQDCLNGTFARAKVADTLRSRALFSAFKKEMRANIMKRERDAAVDQNRAFPNTCSALRNIVCRSAA
jgi:hypothetical protein